MSKKEFHQSSTDVLEFLAQQTGIPVEEMEKENA
jgi:hypothetical protein